MKSLILQDARREESSRTGSAVLNYRLGRSRALFAAFIHLPGGKIHIFGWKVLNGFGKA